MSASSSGGTNGRGRQSLWNTQSCLIPRFPKALPNSNLCARQRRATGLFGENNSLKDTKTWKCSTDSYSENNGRKTAGETQCQRLSQAFITFSHYHFSKSKVAELPGLLKQLLPPNQTKTSISASTDIITRMEDTAVTAQLILHSRVFTDSSLALFY